MGDFKARMGKIIDKIVTFGIVMLVGSTLANEMNKQLPKELQINFRKIFIQALLFGLICGTIGFLISSIMFA